MHKEPKLPAVKTACTCLAELPDPATPHPFANDRASNGRSRGYSPIVFAKAVRLKRAREILMSGDPGVTVLATAFHCNFASPGHFARDYREAFGELPSETLASTPR